MTKEGLFPESRPDFLSSLADHKLFFDIAGKRLAIGAIGPEGIPLGLDYYNRLPPFYYLPVRNIAEARQIIHRETTSNQLFISFRDLPEEERLLLTFINEERQERGFAPLIRKEFADQAAESHSQAMAAGGVFSHLSPPAYSFFHQTAIDRLKIHPPFWPNDRVKIAAEELNYSELGFPNPGKSGGTGECAAAVTKKAPEALEAFKKSLPHWSALMNLRAKYCGLFWASDVESSNPLYPAYLTVVLSWGLVEAVGGWPASKREKLPTGNLYRFQSS